MSRFFGKKKVEVAMSPAEAIQMLRETEEMLARKQVFLEKKIDEELKIARANAKRNKRVALMALRWKKQNEVSMKKFDGILMIIALQREALESPSINAELLQRMKEASQFLKSNVALTNGAHSGESVHVHRHLYHNNLHDLMNKVAEQLKTAQEISETISNPQTEFEAQYDDDDVLAELEELEQEALHEKLSTVEGPANIKLPSVPTGEPKGAVKPKEDYLLAY